MKRIVPKHETLLEIGIAVFAGLLVTLLAFMLSAWRAGSGQRAERENEAPPRAESIPHERHQQTSVASPR